MSQTLGPQGIELIQHFESLELKSYPDDAGVWTIGWGTTRINGVPVRPGMTCTKAQATQWMQADCRAFEAHILRVVKVPLSQHQFDALVSFVYNVGADGFTGSTLRKRINARAFVEEARFTDWNKATIKGVLTPMAGLTRRRKAEYHLYTTGTLRFTF